MPLLQIVVLALVQGITEFLPVSSSAHLILVPVVTGWDDQGLTMDVAVHVGTLGAVILYFWRDLFGMLVGFFQLATGKKAPGARLAFQIIIATLPLIGAGFALNKYGMDWLRSIEVIGWATIGFGLLLWVIDKVCMTLRKVEHLTWGGAILIGIAQVLALIPGTSRSGITMTAARLIGFERTDSARISMLLGIPAIAGAGVLKGKELYESGNAMLTDAALTGAGLSFVAALISIALLMAWLKKASYTPFVIYRLLLGAGLLGLYYTGTLA